MSKPIVFISHLRIKEGKFDSWKEASPQIAEEIKTDKPGTIVFLAYANEEGTEATVVHIFPDAAGAALHFQGAGERTKRASEWLQAVRWEIYGDPGDEVMEAMKKFAASGIAMTVKPHSVGGYIRF